MDILWLKSDLLHPVDRGSRIRSYHIVRRLAARHRIKYLALADDSTPADAWSSAAEYSSETRTVPFEIAARGTLRFFAEAAANLFQPLPYSLERYRVAEYARVARELAQSVDLVLCDFLTPAVNLELPLPVPSVLFQHNVESEIWRRHASVGGPMRRLYFGRQWRRMERFESRVCRQFDHVIAVSDDDRDFFTQRFGVPAASTVPTGVDVDFFRPEAGVPRGTREIVFVGSMAWMPNQDGVLWFVREAWPRIRMECPEATLTIVGRDPSSSITRLGDGQSGITVTGRVDDVRPFLERAALTVVPLRVGGGTRLKIFEAMAMECPVVSTTVGAEGLPLQPGEHLLLAETGSALAEACLGLLHRPEAGRLMAQRGAALVRENFSWDVVAERFEQICADVAGGSKIQ